MRFAHKSGNIKYDSRDQDLQDEALALNVQINVSSDQNTKLAKENRELINRWMARVGQEADAMNDASNFS